MPMLNNVKPVVLICLTVIVIATLIGTVFLIENGFAADAATLPIIVGGVITVVGSQSQTHAVAVDTNAKVTEVLNGGIVTPVEHAVRKTLTKMAAEDEKAGTNVVQTAVDVAKSTAVPAQPPETA